jgi:hypothetical protein
MKKSHLVLVLMVGFLILQSNLFAQDKFSIRIPATVRSESQLSYNFFTGPDAADFSTSMAGFGSGLLDFFGTRTSLDLINIGTKKIYISAGAGFSVQKYRLSNNLVFGLSEENQVTWTTDPDETRDYVNSFFGYGKSKLITTSFYFPAEVNLLFGENVHFSAGGYIDLNLTARYKMKYLVGDDKVKEIIRSSEFRNFHPSTAKYGVSASLYHKKWDMGLAASYSLTPFFKAGMGPDIHEAHVSASFRMMGLKKDQ